MKDANFISYTASNGKKRYITKNSLRWRVKDVLEDHLDDREVEDQVVVDIVDGIMEIFENDYREE